MFKLKGYQRCAFLACDCVALCGQEPRLAISQPRSLLRYNAFVLVAILPISDILFGPLYFIVFVLARSNESPGHSPCENKSHNNEHIQERRLVCFYCRPSYSGRWPPGCQQLFTLPSHSRRAGGLAWMTWTQLVRAEAGLCRVTVSLQGPNLGPRLPRGSTGLYPWAPNARGTHGPGLMRPLPGH